jgi:hypothetical protein
MTPDQENFVLARLGNVETTVARLERENIALANSLKLTNDMLMMAVTFTAQMDIDAIGSLLPQIKNHIDALAAIK